MNYRVFLDTESEQLLGNFEKEPNLRPSLHDIIQIGASKILYVVTRIIPNTESTVQPTSLDYFVKRQDSSNDSVSLRGSQNNVQRQINRGY